ncbi:hypothetical protein IHE45_17G045100 [Dioscorea alata]|uniref:Uncharacterized protein n=1 Tax=Dioscorea alata TaxID=55571 RepID=A0ACB7UBV7_DIOAL|nr:hypothetical protein IHE45_17G045100 [Dioscorea alata]
MKKGGRPPRFHQSKNTFAKKIYNNYTSYRKLQTEKMTPREFYLRKKNLLSESRASVFDRLALPKKQSYKKTTPFIPRSRFQWIRKQDEEMEDLEVHTVRVITEGSEHPPEPERPFTRLRKKITVGTSSMQEEDINQALQERAKAFSQAGFQTPPRRNNDSSEEEDDNLILHRTKIQCLQN